MQREALERSVAEQGIQVSDRVAGFNAFQCWVPIFAPLWSLFWILQVANWIKLVTFTHYLMSTSQCSSAAIGKA